MASIKTSVPLERTLEFQRILNLFDNFCEKLNSNLDFTRKGMFTLKSKNSNNQTLAVNSLKLSLAKCSLLRLLNIRLSLSPLNEINRQIQLDLSEKLKGVAGAECAVESNKSEPICNFIKMFLKIVTNFNIKTKNENIPKRLKGIAEGIYEDLMNAFSSLRSKGYCRNEKFNKEVQKVINDAIGKGPRGDGGPGGPGGGRGVLDPKIIPFPEAPGPTEGRVMQFPTAPSATEGRTLAKERELASPLLAEPGKTGGRRTRRRIHKKKQRHTRRYR